MLDEKILRKTQRIARKLKAAEFVYVGNKITSATFLASYRYVKNKKLSQLMRNVFNSSIRCQGSKERRPFLFGYEKGTWPYKNNYLTFYVKGFGFDCDEQYFTPFMNKFELIHHTRGFKFEIQSGRIKFLNLKFHVADKKTIDKYVNKAKKKDGLIPNGIPVLVSFWSDTAKNRAHPFEIGWYADIEDVNSFSEKHNLPKHTKSIIPHSHFYISVAYSPAGIPKKVKVYYRPFLTKEDFAKSTHLVYNLQEKKYYEFDLISKKIIREIDPEEHRR